MEAGSPATLRPLSIGEVLDVAIKIYLRNALVLFGIVLAVVAPVQVLSSLVETSARDDEFVAFDETTGEPQFADQSVGVVVAGVIVVTLLTLLAGTLATGACFKAIADGYLGERPSVKSSLGFAIRRLHSIVWVSVLSLLAAGLGLLLCVAPGVYIYVAFAAAVPVLLTEGVRGTKALGRSRRLVEGRWWPTAAIVLLGYLLAAIVGGILAAVAGAVSVTDPANDVVAFAASALTGILSSMLTTPFAAAFITVMYFDLRVRKEGFDLELLAQRIGLTARAEGGYLPPPELRSEPRPPTGEQPPFWPPPPGWRPSGGDERPE